MNTLALGSKKTEEESTPGKEQKKINEKAKKLINFGK